jgi:hypothetical protein
MGQRPTQGDEKALRPATTFYRTVALSFVIPSEPGFPPHRSHRRYLCGSLHMQSIEAATPDRKFGEAEGSAVLRTFRGYVFRQIVAE